MKKAIFIQALFILLNLISVDKIYSRSKTVIEIVYSIINIKLPVIEINDTLFTQHIDSLVLSYGFHNREFSKNDIYCIDIEQCNEDNESIIYISLLPSSVTDNYIVSGCLRINGILFLLAGDESDNLFSLTDRHEEIQYKKNIGYIKEGEFFPSPILEMRDSPIWIFTYRNKVFDLYRKDFIPENIVSD